jgi:hypothetical protein
LTVGKTYAFKIRARNTVGLSLYSEIIDILAAQPPDAPLNVANVPAPTTTAWQIGLSWTEGSYNGGSHVIDYRIRFKEEASPVEDYVIFADNHVP